ncbi:MAG: competence/damage-inducible protein A [Myxococcota bacterium]|nr:competence/damage-inducible protein A [Myxococcota bacterium]
MPTAAFIAIGDEILAGKFQDENSPYMIRRLREQGVDLKRIVVLPDDLEILAQEVRFCSERFDHVFTSGGIGPTHDDITLEAIALAFHEPLVLFDDIVQLMRRRFGDTIPEPALQMARLPKSTQLHWEEGLKYPLVSVRNVFIFPGVPSFLKIKFEAGAYKWMGEPVHTAKVVTQSDEVGIAATLSEAEARWPDVSVGSYPRFDDGPFHVIATIEGRNAEQVEACRSWLEDQLPNPRPQEPSG